MRILVVLLLPFLFLVSIIAQSSDIHMSPILESAHYGVLVKELGGDECLKAFQNDKSFTPASVMKLVTTATALESLGADYRYKTTLEYTGNIVDGVLYGDVVICGGGDPTLGSRYFYDAPYEFLNVWCRELQVLGIDSIAGGIVSDASAFDKQVIPDKWIWEDIGNYYGAGCYGLSCFDNRYHLFFGESAVGQIAPVDSVLPRCEDLSFDNHVKGANSNRDDAYIYGSPWGLKKQIYGTIPAGRKFFEIKGALPNPPLVLADMLKHSLVKNGVEVSKASRVQWESLEESRKGISIWFSPPVAEIVRVTNKESNNLFAEHLLKSIVMCDSSAATLSSAIDTMIAMWASCGLKTDGVRVYDGSGLSRASLLTPDFLVAVLDYMNTSVNREAFYASLAISGEDGTFKYFLDGTELEGKVHGKSGSMSGVRCYAGIIEKSQAENYSFCIMVNNFTSSSAEVRGAIESYLLELVE